MESFGNRFQVPQNLESDRSSAFIPEDYKEICRTKNIHNEHRPLKLNIAQRHGAGRTGVTKTKKMNFTSLEHKIGFNKSMNRALIYHTYRIENNTN